ncbi:MAG: M20/M25/M40 family metallo-hydrolase [Tissierellia bacterium]|nr:M20/M25/M40 family metallo-hydrolase [Tissierellia bacterium]MDD4779634.1 M20/M25/M40 family metallo-hydrolase [Tissierellia bacterium]
MINKERLIETFMEYVKVDSETKNEKAIGERIMHDLNYIGLSAEFDDAGKKIGSNGNNIYCFIPGNNDSEPLLFSAHMDTVTPGIGIEPYIDGNYIKSKGNTILGGDDKSGIVAILEALRIIKENNLKHRPIEIMFSIGEEGGLNGVKNFDFSKLKSNKGVILDSSNGTGHIVTSAPGQTRIFAKITGKASHAGGSPEDGISAIMVGAEAITNMKLLRIDEETTANIGTFNAVGPTNIVSPLAEIVAEARSRCNEKLKEQTNHMVDCLIKSCEKYKAKLEYEIEECYHSYAIDDNDELVEMVSNICKNLGLEVKKIPSGGGSDANVYNKNGIKAINIGTGMEFPHTLEERLSINDFVDVTKVVLEIMTK